MATHVDSGAVLEMLAVCLSCQDEINTLILGSQVSSGNVKDALSSTVT